MTLFEKLELFGQAPTLPLLHPWQRDINRLEARWKTVRNYVKTFDTMTNEIAEFNKEYGQNYKMREINTAINTRTFKNLKQELKEFRNFRRRFIGKIENEADIIERNLFDSLRTVQEFIKPARGLSEPTIYQTLTGYKLQKFRGLYESVVPSEPLQRIEYLKNVKARWSELQSALDTYFYNSNAEIVTQAWTRVKIILETSSPTPLNLMDSNEWLIDEGLLE